MKTRPALGACLPSVEGTLGKSGMACPLAGPSGPSRTHSLGAQGLRRQPGDFDPGALEQNEGMFPTSNEAQGCLVAQG